MGAHVCFQVTTLVIALIAIRMGAHVSFRALRGDAYCTAQRELSVAVLAQ